MKIDFTKMDGLVPVVVQDSRSQRVLMVGFMNDEAYAKTTREQKITFYSRSKKRLWTKGETSGHFLLVDEIRVDCDADTLLIKATPTGPVCHTGNDTCFDERNDVFSLAYLEKIIHQRKTEPVEKSYTRALFEKGINKVAQKVGEEAVELVIEAKDHDREKFLGEAADLLFHYLVLLAAKGYSLADVEAVLKSRHQK
ncbi:MAG: bifunctional phosphoribosyl-AMP cyclohydrolase/phosphoribosyl-ATP diphosphatase HisIE [Cyclobacteriaceae bacterium]|jgi:phosphoribosyl-ATP pyrophosphohydrolase/phosphoribosyl-AMP cyclohydrolase|nr:bifunctional phosphoribosyl-AMP cyclohydrolase/phosphoribosyl-ATP diphosphatase HisIE [Cyclobacteriaceae bacterium]